LLLVLQRELAQCTFAQQLHRLKRLEGKVDLVITDSPILLTLVYDPDNNQLLHQLVRQQHNTFDNINIFLQRKKAFVQAGRMESEIEA